MWRGEVDYVCFMKGGYNVPTLKTRRRELRKNNTKAERVLWECLRKNKLGVKFYRQYSVGKYIVDFYCPRQRLAVELDGGYHLKAEIRIHDEARTKLLEKQGIIVIRFWNTEVFDSLETVLQKIQEYIFPSSLK